MKKKILQTFLNFGYDIKRVDTTTDEALYQELYPEESLLNHRFYNIGAGNFKHPYWTNVDGDSEWYAGLNGTSQIGIPLDLFAHKPLPVDDHTAELIYTSHTIEHVDDASVAYLFKDCFRILKKGGVLRIVTPDIDLAYSAWQRGDRKYFLWADDARFNINVEKYGLKVPLKRASLAQIFLDDFAADATELTLVENSKHLSDEDIYKLFRELPYEEALNYCTSLCLVENQKKYPFRHINWFNEAKLVRMLKHAGFTTIKKSAYLQSEAAVLRNSKLFDQTIPQVSLYVEATR